MKRGLWTLKVPLARSRLRKVLSGKHGLSFIKKKKREKGRMTQGSDPKLQNMELRARENYSQDLRLNQGMFNICSAGFQNYNGPVTPLCPPFSLFLNSYPVTPVSPWCVGCMEGHISCCFSFTGGEELYSRGCT